MIVEVLRVVRDCSEVVHRPMVRRDDESQIGPLFFSFGDRNLECGACSFLLIRGARSARAILDAVLVCPNCGACNEAVTEGDAQASPVTRARRCGD